MSNDADKLAQPVLHIDRETFDHALEDGRNELREMIREVVREIVREELAAQAAPSSTAAITPRVEADEAAVPAILSALRPEVVQAVLESLRKSSKEFQQNCAANFPAMSESQDDGKTLQDCKLRFRPEPYAADFPSFPSFPRSGAPERCHLPQPAGWYCTREAGHDGPCAREACTTPAREYEARCELPLARPGRWRDGDSMDSDK